MGMAGNSFSFVLKYGLYSERYGTLASCSWTSILLREAGGRVMYWARASRVLEEEAGIFTDMSTEATVGPTRHSLCEALVDQ